MDRTRRVVAAAVLLAVVVVAGFGFVDFRAATSQAERSASVATASVNQTAAGLERGVVVHVVPAGVDDPAADALQADLAAALRDRGVAVTEADALREQYDRPALVLRVEDCAVRYNPLVPSARVSWTFVYSTNGRVPDLATLAGPVNSSEYPYRVDGQATWTDATRGVVSRPAYRRHVSESVANATADLLLSNVESHPGGSASLDSRSERLAG